MNRNQPGPIVEVHPAGVRGEMRIAAERNRTHVGHHGDRVLNSACGRHPPQLEVELRASPAAAPAGGLLNSRVVDHERSRPSRRAREHESRAIARVVEPSVHGRRACEIPRGATARVNLVDVAAVAVHPRGVDNGPAVGSPGRRILHHGCGGRQPTREVGDRTGCLYSPYGYEGAGGRGGTSDGD